MKTGKFFSQKQLLKLSGLSDRQLRTLIDYNLIEEKNNSPRYNLSELIYCRIVSLLRTEYSMQSIRDLLNPCKEYDDNLITGDYGFIWLDDCQKLHTCFLETEEYKKLMQDVFVNFESKTLFKKDGTVKKINFICFNLLEILCDLTCKAIDYNFDDVELKFAKFLNYSSPEVTV